MGEGEPEDSAPSERALKRKPKLITINHDDDCASHIGRTADGRQFFLTTPFIPAQREFVALYLFDSKGKFQKAYIDDLGKREKLTPERAREAFERRFAQLGPVKLGRIRVEPFTIKRFGREFGLVPLLCGLYGLQMLVRRQSIKVYENGFVYKGRGETETVFWHDVLDFYEAITLYSVQGVPVTKREYSVTASGGRTIVLEQNIRNIAKIGERIREETFKHKFPDAYEKILNGQSVVFGGVALTKNVLRISGHDIALADIRKVRSKNGKIVLKGDSLFRINDIDYSETPNAHVLVALLTKLIGGNKI